MDKQSGVYESFYGNACEYYSGNDLAYDLDMGEQIPLEAVCFDKFIREVD